FSARVYRYNICLYPLNRVIVEDDINSENEIKLVAYCPKMERETLVTTEEEARLKLGIRSSKVDAASLSKSSLLATYNPTLQLDALRIRGEKNQALMMLQRITATKMKKAVALEIMSTYVYFGDFEGALTRYQSVIAKSFELDKLKVLVEIHISNTKCKD